MHKYINDIYYSKIELRFQKKYNNFYFIIFNLNNCPRTVTYHKFILNINNNYSIINL